MPDSGSESIDRYDILVYVADRLEDDGSNTRQARDFSRAVLKVALAQLRRSEAVLSVSAEPLQPFVQKFADNLAGYYTTLSVMVRNDIENC
jgi:HD superfamily phosphohydrolase YqeK